MACVSFLYCIINYANLADENTPQYVSQFLRVQSCEL